MARRTSSARSRQLDVKKLSEGLALNLVGLLIKNRFYADNRIDYATQQCLEGFGALDLPQEIAGYKPRPLEGVWATPPFLHNGSVPTLYQMLLPPERRDQQVLRRPARIRSRARGLRDAARCRWRWRRLLAGHQHHGQSQHRARLRGRRRDLEEASGGSRRPIRCRTA